MIAAPYWRKPHMAKSKKSVAKTARKRKMQSKDKTSSTRAESKQAKLIEMLKRPDGATIEEIAKKFEWQSHTVRGAIAALKKKLGLNVQSEKVEGRGRIYRIEG
jgi:predicted HTH transcriptional regulator